MHIINDAVDIGLITSTDEAIDYSVSFVEIDNVANTIAPGSSEGQITSTTTTTIVSAASTGTVRQIKTITIRNSGVAANRVTLVKGTTPLTPAISLAPGESAEFIDGSGLRTFDEVGRERNKDTSSVGYSGKVFEFHKIGTASEAIGVRYGMAKDSGFPGAWVPGSPGVNGWWVDASQQTNAANPAGATQAGSPQLPNPASGSYYLTGIGITSSVAHLLNLLDLLWYNTGLTVTTTTEQSITMPGSQPSRDANGSTDGEGVGAAIYVTTATTNGGAITNTTLNYTNSEGVAGRTGTISSFPATAVAGTFVLFQLQAGDRGVRSIEGVTLGTTYGGGAISLVLYRMLASVPNPIANVGGIMNKLGPDLTGVRIYNGTALWLMYMSSATTATTVSGSLTITER